MSFQRRLESSLFKKLWIPPHQLQVRFLKFGMKKESISNRLLNFLKPPLMAKQLVFIGDSLTEWFDWQRRFPDYSVANLGVSGEPVEGLLGRRDLIRSRIDKPGHIFLMTGINNIMLEQYQVVTPYREIVRNLITWYKKAEIVVQSILPVELSWINNDIIKDTNLDLERIAREYNSEYLDIYSLFIDSGKGNPKSAYFQEDGVHLSGKGYAIWADEIERFLGGKCRKIQNNLQK